MPVQKKPTPKLKKKADPKNKKTKSVRNPDTPAIFFCSKSQKLTKKTKKCPQLFTLAECLLGAYWIRIERELGVGHFDLPPRSF